MSLERAIKAKVNRKSEKSRIWKKIKIQKRKKRNKILKKKSDQFKKNFQKNMLKVNQHS